MMKSCGFYLEAFMDLVLVWILQGSTKELTTTVKKLLRAKFILEKL